MGEIGNIGDLNLGNYHTGFLKLEIDTRNFRIKIVVFFRGTGIIQEYHKISIQKFPIQNTNGAIYRYIKMFLLQLSVSNHLFTHCTVLCSFFMRLCLGK